LSLKRYEERKKAAAIRMQAMLLYTEEDTQCRSSFLVEYFGEKNVRNCGHCDVCLDKNKSNQELSTNNRLLSQLQSILENNSLKPDELVKLFSEDPSIFLEKMRIWMDERIIKENEDGSISWNQ
jgi:ATP-dependent DNA helicase RecQ